MEKNSSTCINIEFISMMRKETEANLKCFFFCELSGKCFSCLYLRQIYRLYHINRRENEKSLKLLQGKKSKCVNELNTVNIEQSL